MINRRRFLSDNFSAVTSFGVGAALSGLGNRLAKGESPAKKARLIEVADESTGLPLLRLPEGFRYLSFGWAGDQMSDGMVTPAAHDGMGVVRSDGDVVTLVRNHEISHDGKCIPQRNGLPFDARARAGCTSLRFDTTKGQWLDDWVSLTGTSRNCAGGVTPWGTWLTCEETVLGPGDRDPYKDNRLRSFRQTHGWIFEVDPAPVGGPDSVEQNNRVPRPIPAMGRFVHEAVAIDRQTGIVYETEDRGTAGFYRFVPTKYGDLSAGGVLEICEVVGQPDLRGGFVNGTEFDVRWHPIPDPTLAHTPGTRDVDATPAKLGDELGVFQQGKALGGSTFSRLEGCWFGDGLVYFDATNGGEARAGQIWQYDPRREKLTLLFESPDKPTLNMPDNLCVSPRGGIVLCEDNDYGANEYPHRVFGLSQAGQLRLLAENNCRLDGQRNGFRGDFRGKEWAGATFSPDGKWLFLNMQSPGITLAITGPWQDTLA